MSEHTAASLEGRPAEERGLAAPSQASTERFHPRNWSFRIKLALLALALGLVPGALAVALLAVQSDRTSQDTQSMATQARAQAGAALVGQVLDTDLRLLEGLAATDPAQLLVAQPGGAQQIQQYRLSPLFTAATSAVPSLDTIYVANSGGAILAANQPSLLDSKAGGVLALQEALTSGLPVALAGTALSSGQPALIVAAPIRVKGVLGVVVGEFSPATLFAALQAAGGSLVLADGRAIDGHTLPTGAPAQILGPRLAPALPPSPFTPALNGGLPERLSNGSWAVAIVPQREGEVPAGRTAGAGSPGTVPGATGQAGDPTAQAGLGALPILEVPAVGTAQALLGSGTVALLLILGLLTTLVAVATSLALTRPLSVLARALVAVRAGNYGQRVQVRRRDEIGQIAATVDLLVARTQALVTDLDNQRLELENGIIQLFTELAEAASGDLTVRPTMSESSLGAVADSVGILLERFNATVKHIQATASAVSIGTSQVAATVLRVSQEAQKQAAQLTSGVSAITEMASSAQAVSQRTQAATDVAAQAVVAVENGNRAVTYAREAVKRTSDTSKKAARQVKSLGESAQSMGSALLLVQRNTEELHLIAGNASIEAARYAESGGVFRTVADSIEQLAQQSQVALRQIQSVVETTQRETSRVVAAIDEVTAEVVNVAKAVGLAGENFDTINVVVQRLADLNVFIASASEQQAHMAADVAEVIGTLNQVSVQTSMNTAASAEAAVRLRQLTEQLNDSVSTLKVS